MIEASVRKLLINAQPVQTLVGDRVYLGYEAQNERRARIVVTLASRVNDHTFDGPAGYITGSVNVACLAPSYADAKTLTDAARTVLDNYTGFGVSTYIEIDRLEVDEERDIPAAPLEGQALPTFGVNLSVSFLYRDDRNQ